MIENLKLEGTWTFTCENPDGSIAWTETVHNSVVNQGLNDILSVYFVSGTQKTTWYIGLVDAPSFANFNAGDTAASHAGWTESVAYSEGVRQTWGAGAPSSQSITNASSANFTCNANGTQIKGAFLISNNTKGGNTGTLWSEGAFASIQTLQSGQVLHVTYTLNAASS